MGGEGWSGRGIGRGRGNVLAEKVWRAALRSVGPKVGRCSWL